MKKIILTIIALLCIVGSEAKNKEVVWEKPTTENGNVYGDGFFNIAMDVNRVEMKETETTVSVTVNWRNDYDSFKFQFASGTYLLAEGKKYALVSADGIELDKLSRPMQTTSATLYSISNRCLSIPRCLTSSRAKATRHIRFAAYVRRRNATRCSSPHIGAMNRQATGTSPSSATMPYTTAKYGT